MPHCEAVRPAAELLKERSARADYACREAAQKLFQTDCADYLLLAVGGYGRRELYPYSDIDLLLVVESEADRQASKEPLSELHSRLWDSGIGKISLRARTLADCCTLHEDDIEFHVSLLDQRLLAGDPDLYARATCRLAAFLERNGAVIIRQLAARARRQHTKFGNTVYHLEPNVKEGPGGLRDVHLLHWLKALAPRHHAIRDSAAGISNAADFFRDVRCLLHQRTGRDHNVLTFELQDECATRLDGAGLQTEEWMRRYYGFARRVSQAATRALDYVEEHDPSLFRQFQNWRTRLSTAEFTISHGRLLLRNPADALRSPESVLRIFAFAGRHGIRLSWDTQRRIQSDLERLKRLFAETPPPWAAWTDVFSKPHVALALAEMQESGLLPVAFPEWVAIDSLVVRDFYHRYTVDEHTILAIETVDGLASKRPDNAERFRELSLDSEDYLILRLALLLHDIGKGTRPGDHVRGSMECAVDALQRMDAPEPLRASVLFLIEQHLTLSAIMNSRDLQDSDTAAWLTSRVRTEEDLRRLTLFTYADINAVNPGALTPWRIEQLWRVYAMGSNQLIRELGERAPGSEQQDLPADLRQFVHGLPRRYRRTHTVREIEQHREMANELPVRQVVTELVRGPGAYLLTLVARDHPGLFAAICGTLASFGLNIVKAEAASNAEGIALDFFRFVDPMKTLELNPDEAERLQATIESVAKGTIDVADLLRRRPAQRGKGIKSKVRLDNGASQTATLVEFTGEDRPGLLYTLASTLTRERCDIDVVMIDTEGHKAIDVFYVTKDGSKLADQECADIERKLLEAVETAHD